MKGQTLAIIGILLLAVSNASASFWFECQYMARVNDIRIIDSPNDDLDVRARLTIIKSWLKGGHIKDRNCGLNEGQVIRIYTGVTIKEALHMKRFNRSIEKKFFSYRHDIREIKASDIVVIYYRYSNGWTGDSQTWEVLLVLTAYVDRPE